MATIAPAPSTITPASSSFGAPVNPLPYRSSEPRQPSVVDRLRNKIQDQLDGKQNNDFGVPDGRGYAPVNTEGAGKFVPTPPPFTGGQMVGVVYIVKGITTAIDKRNGQNITFRNFSSGVGIIGKFTGVITTLTNGIYEVRLGSSSDAGQVLATINSEYYAAPVTTINSVTREGGLPDTGGNIATPSERVNQGYDGDTSRNKAKSPPPIIPPSFSPAVGWGVGRGVDTSAVRAGLGLGAETNTGKAPTTTPERKAPPPAPNPSTRPTPTPSPQPPSPNPSEKPKSPVPSNPETPSDNRSIMQKLIEVAAILGFINANTEPSAQRVNAKNGTCDAMQSPSCTQGFENRIKDPINQNIDATRAQTTAILGNQATQNAAIASVAGKVDNVAEKATNIFNRVGSLWNNSLVDKAVGYLTMITVMHNAAMLSRSIADTLGSAIDQGLVSLGLGVQDKDGNMLGVGQVFQKTTQDIIRNVIGAQTYENLNNTWIQANRIYQTGINLVSNVQSILDSTTAVAELTSNRLGTWMNAARNAGLVRENAYGAQSENVTKFNAWQNRLENLEQGVSNVASITGNIVSVQQSVNELKSNRQEFENALKNKPQGAGLPENDPEKQATQTKKAQSIYTIGDFSVVKPPETP